MVDLLEFLKSDKPNLPTQFSIALGELIRKARIQANLSQKVLALKAFFNQAAISQIETGKRAVSAEEIVYLSSALNKPIQYFYSMEFLNPVNQNSLSILEQELIVNVRDLSDTDLKKIIAQIKAIKNI